MNARIPTNMKAVAEVAGVSVSSVSRALARPDLVSPGTRQRIVEAAEQLGYVPNMLPKFLRQLETRSIIVIVPNITNDYYANVVAGIERAAARREYGILLGITHNDPAKEIECSGYLLSRRVDGIISMTGSATGAIALNRPAGDAAPPVVIAGLEATDRDLPTVRIDDAGAVDKAMQHLLDLGHRRIGLIAGPDSRVDFRERMRGYREALERAGIDRDPALVREGDFRLESGWQAADELLSLPEPPTAILAVNDEMALGAIKAAKMHGLDIPRDVSIIGIDNIRYGEFCEPALTTIAQPMAEIGVEAMQLLANILEGRVKSARTIVLPTQLIVRGSTGPAPAA